MNVEIDDCAGATSPCDTLHPTTKSDGCAGQCITFCPITGAGGVPSVAPAEGFSVEIGDGVTGADGGLAEAPVASDVTFDGA